MMAGKDARQRLGAWGERVAALHLESQGYEIVARNWRCPLGEIDLVARAGALWLFVEVRTRRGRALGTPEESMARGKAERVLKLAQHYLYDHGLEDAEWRVDLIAVELDEQGKLLRCEQIENMAPPW
jgi:putative endonuclease